MFCFVSDKKQDTLLSDGKCWILWNSYKTVIRLCATTEAITMNNSELFKLKLSQAEHVSVLKTALKLSTFSDPDICLVSREGFKVYTHRWCKNIIYEHCCLPRWWSLIDSLLFTLGPCCACTAPCWAACCVKLVTAAAAHRMGSQSLQQVPVFTLSYSCW